MARSLFANVSSPRRGIFTFAVVAVFLAVLFHSQFFIEIEAQQPAHPIKAAPIRSSAAKASAGEVFLELAKAVGQELPAKRLIDHKLKFDPSSQPRYWAIVDFGQPSTSKRFYVFDTVQKKVDTYYVAHGRGSEGPSDDGMAELFSNNEGSLSSSLGIYRTREVYDGRHGRSLRLEGLEPTNSNALARGIVLHTADYVSEAFIRQTGRLGRSEGCFAVERALGDTLIDQLKTGTYIVASKK
jgi:hypothetical protein